MQHKHYSEERKKARCCHRKDILYVTNYGPDDFLYTCVHVSLMLTVLDVILSLILIKLRSPAVKATYNKKCSLRKKLLVGLTLSSSEFIYH